MGRVNDGGTKHARESLGIERTEGSQSPWFLLLFAGDPSLGQSSL